MSEKHRRPRDGSTDEGASGPGAVRPVVQEDEGGGAHPSYLVCLGASAGGLETLEAFFGAIPSDTDAAFVIVSHLSPDFKSLMPELLSRHTKMRVRTAADGLELERNTISIIPPGKNMAFREGRLRLESQDRSGTHVLQLPIDIFLQSVAAERPHRTVALILSGTGSDGSRGIRALKAAGGIVLAQDPETARFDGMPRAAIDTGAVDATGNPRQLAGSVLDLIKNGALSELPGDDDDGATEIVPIIESIRAQLHQDVSYLRPSMLRRRVRRRMALLNIGTVGEYAERLMADAAEARALKRDTLIGVTSFFRDPDAFRFLQRHLSGHVLRTPASEPFRAWVPACSSGEEVYSLAILIREALDANGMERDVKIFATDIDEDSLARASKAVYPAHAAEDIGPSRLEKYFTIHGKTIHAKNELREMVIFAHHNLVRDPPFTKIDLVSCRNFLIYLTPTTQEGVLSSLHFSLNRGGTLFLGSAEALGRVEGEFESVDSRYKIFTKARSTVLPSMRLRAGLQDPLTSGSRPLILTTRDRERDTQNRQVLETLVEREDRSVAIISTEGALLDIVGDAAGVFRVPRGRATSDIARMLAEPLVVAVSTGLQKIRRSEEEDPSFVVELTEDPPRRVTVRLTRLPAIGSGQERILLLIEPVRTESHGAPLDTSSLDQDTAERMSELQSELLQTRESLQSTIEELQSANEEQQSTNEELVASNEELQSTNEELQSVNEELFTVNVEYQNKIQELAVVAADLNNLLRNINVGILFLDEELRIRKFTPGIEDVVKLVEHDVGRSIEHFAHSLGSEFVPQARRVVETGIPYEEEGRSARGSWVMVRIMPYVTHTGRESGVVATFVDITGIKNANEMTRVANKQLASVNTELKTQREELEEMFSIVAHDLKRPVIALDGLISIIRQDEQLHERLEEKSKEANGTAPDETPEPGLLQRAHHECARMRQMLMDLEAVSEIQKRPIARTEVALQEWLDRLIGEFRERASERGVRINSTCDAGRFALPCGFIEEIFTNLMENAFKYGCTDNSPRIDVSGRVSNNAFELTVADNGVGIAREHHQRVFEPFRRLDPSTAPGSGVGLLAVKRLANRLGGTVIVDSAPGRGAKFVVTVPLVADEDESGASVRGKPRLLIVEDDLLDARSIERCLGESHALTRAQDLQEAESRLEQERFDVVLLDLSLPDGHGLELVNRMTAKPHTRTPIVVITGHGEGIDTSSGDAVIGAYVSKSDVSRERLLEAIERATRNEGAQAAGAT